MNGIAAAPHVAAHFGRYRLEHDHSGWGFSDGCIGVSCARSPLHAWFRWRRAVKDFAATSASRRCM